MHTSARMGRPPGTAEHEALVHVRLSRDLKVALDDIRLARMDRPSLSALIREAMANYVAQCEARR